MFFFGVFTYNKMTDVVILELSQQTAKKRYIVRNHLKISKDDLTQSTINLLAEKYYDSQYLFKKKVFSQDRRPAKFVRAYPKIIMNLSQDSCPIILGLDQKKINKEVIAFMDLEEESILNQEFEHGNCHKILKENFLAPSIKVDAGGRLSFSSTTSHLEALYSTHLSSVPNQVKNIQPQFQFCYSIFLVLWYRESIRHKRGAYIASAKMTRKRI